MRGVGVLSRFGVATEATAGTAESTVDVFMPILSESVASNRPAVASGSIVGDSMTFGVVPGVISCEGGMNMELEGQVSGQAIWLWNGDGGYDAAALDATSGIATAAPTPVKADGGTLAAGTYKYRVSTVLMRTIDGVALIMPNSAESAGVITETTNLKVNVGWTNPSGLPAGHSHYGTIVWRTGLGGSVEYFLKFVKGTGVTYADTGAVALDTSITPYTATFYSHTFIGSPPVTEGDRLTPFTYFACKNNDHAETYAYSMMDAMKISVPGIGEKVTMEFSLKAVKPAQIANFSPSFVPLAPFVGWHCAVSIDGSMDVTAEKFEINCSNGVNFVPGMNLTPYNRAVLSGAREVKVQFDRQFQDHTYWNDLVNGSELSIAFTLIGGSCTSPVAHGLTALQSGDVAMVPWQFYMVITIPRVVLDKAGGNVGGKDRIIESITGIAFKDADLLTDMQIVMYNTTAAYA